ncbi:hypothetical protein M426DRAFT_318757 [Hypoxylon sp. CI-4A]|nr:hypothetical protein M426DRAFT_318757 [Hypoxylon sp. CI-4A]
MAQHHLDLATAYRETYKAKFRDAFLAGTKKPFIVPLHMIGLWILPTLYLAIPHRNRPWLYRARWLVLAVVVFIGFDIIFHVSNGNPGIAYGVGLAGAWSIVWNFVVLVWTKPQWDAKRVNVRRKSKQEHVASIRDKQPNGSSSSIALQNGNGRKITTPEQSSRSKLTAQNGADSGEKKDSDAANVTGITKDEDVAQTTLRKRQTHKKDELVEVAEDQEFEYYWQEYPADDSLWARLDWAFDIVSTFRMTGWNWAISCLPPYEPPARVGDHQLPLSTVGPQRTRQGYTRYLTRKALLINYLPRLIMYYLIVDLCAVYVTTDPYFVHGPESTEPLPPHLRSLPPILLSTQRNLVSLIGILGMLQLQLIAGALFLTFVPPVPQILGFRVHPWHLPSPQGSFAQVLDRGLPGFWGAWWHQTFRFGFEAPTRYLLREGYVRPKSWQARAAAPFFAFVTSGFVHAAGSYSSISPDSKWWMPPMFFLLAGVGSVLQTWLSRVVFAKVIRRFPQWVRRVGNLAFVLGWMSLTSWMLVDDFCRCGIWLWEPVPVSVVRPLGIGPSPDRRVWRLDLDMLPTWYSGRHWWDSGIAI